MAAIMKPGCSQCSHIQGDWSRIVLFVLMGLATLVGFWYHSAFNDPRRLVRTSVSRTLAAPYTASIEGRVTLGDSLLAAYRIRESHVPGRNLAVRPVGESASLPLTSLDVLWMLSHASGISALDPEDMYDRATRHFSGTLTGRTSVFPSGCYFEYWADMQSLSAVRIVMTGVRRGAAVDARGDSISSVTTLTIRFIPQQSGT